MICGRTRKDIQIVFYHEFNNDSILNNQGFKFLIDSEILATGNASNGKRSRGQADEAAAGSSSTKKQKCADDARTKGKDHQSSGVGSKLEVLNKTVSEMMEAEIEKNGLFSSPQSANPSMSSEG